MSETPSDDEQNITTDHETIRSWVEERDGEPARRTDAVDDDAASLYIIREDESAADFEVLSWDAFFTTFDAEGLAFVYQDRDVGETDEWVYDLIDRSIAAERATVESEAVESALLEGEVVRSQVTETKVIEKTVIETDQIQSEIVASEVIGSNRLDREILDREITDARFVDAPEHLRTATVGTGAQHRTETDESETAESDDALLGDDKDSLLGDNRDNSSVRGDDDRDSMQDSDDSGSMQDDENDSLLGDDSNSLLGGHDDESMRGDDDDSMRGNKHEDDPYFEDDDHTEAHESTEDETPLADSGEKRRENAASGTEIGETVELDIIETARITTELFDRKTVESRVIDRQVTQQDSVEDSQVESEAIDIEGVERTVLESDLIEGAAVGDETDVEPSGLIVSKRGEDDVITSQFVERRVVDVETTDSYQLGCEITDHKLVNSETIRTDIVEREIVDAESADHLSMTDETLEADRSMMETDSTAEPVASDERAKPMAGDDHSEPAASAETATPASGEAGGQTEITEDEIGKRVVSGDEEIGMVSDVEDDTIYVDPHPSTTDKIKAALDWGDTDEDTYPIGREDIRNITDDEVEVTRPESR